MKKCDAIVACRKQRFMFLFYPYLMNIPHSIENLLMLSAQRFFPSSQEDAWQISEDLKTLSEYFSEISQRPRTAIENAHLVESYQILLRSYRGLQTGKRPIIFFDEVI
jgi:hypothetical protein